MEHTSLRRKIHPKYVYLGAIVVLFGLSSYFGYTSYNQSKEIEMLMQERNFFLLETASSTLSREEERALASSTIAELSERLSLTAEELDEIEDNYREEKNKNDDFEDQIKEISGTVGVLDKLSKTDKELLQKYSKVYFLNEHYIPEKIVPIEKKYLYNESVSKSIHGKVEPFLNEMIEDALEDGIKLWVVSAYRSYNEQASLKGAYTTTYGSGANAFSADQGYSEHQLGTAVDFTTEGLGGGLTGFENTPAYQWMLDNASKYGFTLSYPEGNAYYVFEPWHWRFVGEKLARDLDRANASFYDWEQRKIDEYLISIFD
ncbi:M15 family metallopeptidase [Patescibacteria group bacterium]|nr:M15 family metallopeptidase [Patescibacteria group bacterium]